MKTLKSAEIQEVHGRHHFFCIDLEMILEAQDQVVEAVLCLIIEQLICIMIASSKGTNRDLLFLFASGASFLCPVHSWTSGEDLGGNILRHR